MRYLFLLIFFVFSYSFICQNQLDVANINPLLKINANAIIRIEEQTFNVITIEKSLKHERLVVTILNEKGEDQFSVFSRSYNKFIKIKKLEGVIYDRSGSKIKSLKKNEIKDFSNFDASYEVTDDRQKVAFFDKKKYAYPYTIEFSCTEEISNGMFYPVWLPVSSEHVAIERSTFTIIKPSSITFRYKELNIPNSAQVSKNNEEDIYTWTIENRMPSEFEDYMDEDQLPIIYTAPNEFKVENYLGNAYTWKDVGEFNNKLNQGRDELSDVIKQKVKQIIQNETDTLRIIEKLYQYMQSTTRYISLQLGIGGWQTINALEVANKGYGDCKGLSNFMMAILKEAGIKSNRALILAGHNFFRLQSDFPSNQFNHAIVCVPLKKDTVWLECTSQTKSMGYMGSFTGNRKALVMNDSGGTLVNTINYTSEDNTQYSKVIVNIDDLGNANVNANIIYRGIKQEKPSGIITQLNREKQRDFIIKNIDISNFELLDFSFKEFKTRIPKIEQHLELKINKLISINGSAIVLAPNILPSYIQLPISDNNRKYSFYLDPNYYNYTVSDTVIYNFPKDFMVESLPASVNLKSKFGEYLITFSFKNNRLIYCRNLTLTGGTFANTDYQSWMNFAKQINKNDRQRVAFIKK